MTRKEAEDYMRLGGRIRLPWFFDGLYLHMAPDGRVRNNNPSGDGLSEAWDILKPNDGYEAYLDDTELN